MDPTDHMRDRIARLGADPARISRGHLAQLVELDAAQPMDAHELLLAVSVVYRAEPAQKSWGEIEALP